MKSEENWICGIVFCYNEEDLLHYSLPYYLKQSIDLVVIDNCSTDSSLDIVREYEKNDSFPGKIVDVLSVDTNGFEWEKLLRVAGDLMHRSLSSYKWLMLIEPDLFYHSSVRDMSLLEFIDRVNQAGFNVLNGNLFEFYPTDKDDNVILSPLERMQFYSSSKGSGPRYQKIFQYHPSIQFSSSGNIIKRMNPQVAPVTFILKHYQWLSYDHGLQRIFKDRQPRLVEREQTPYKHEHYLRILPEKEDLIKKAETLKIFKINSYLMSEKKFLKVLKKNSQFILLSKFWRRGKSSIGKLFLAWHEVFVTLKGIYLHDKSLILRYGYESLIAGIKSIQRSHLKRKGYHRITVQEMMQQKDVVYGLPDQYHFLLTNFCNAGCFFCNQSISRTEKKQELSLKQFKKIYEHIPDSKRTFSLSGGGEPLLAADFFPIVDHIMADCSDTKVNLMTNGLLLRKFSEEIVKRCFSEIRVSVHGATAENNNRILGVNGYDVYENISQLMIMLKKKKRKTRFVLCCVVSNKNIEDVPFILTRAAQLKISKVQVLFSRFYVSTNIDPQEKYPESLYYHQEKYDQVMSHAKWLARKLGIELIHEPLFKTKFKEQSCLQPWQTMLVDWTGNIYPCTGGEVWFQKQVYSGTYSFGNLIENHLAQCWNNGMYIKMRRTCSSRYDTVLFNDCLSCHNTLCLKGPHHKSGHFINLIDCFKSS